MASTASITDLLRRLRAKANPAAHDEATKPRRPRYDEDNLQRACVRFFDYAHHAERLLLHHSPNEGLLPRTARDGAKRKAMGCRPGFPDLVLLLPRRGYAYLCIELKTPTGRQSLAQREYQEAVEAAGGRYEICRTIEDFINIIEDYMNDQT